MSGEADKMRWAAGDFEVEPGFFGYDTNPSSEGVAMGKGRCSGGPNKRDPGACRNRDREPEQRTI